MTIQAPGVPPVHPSFTRHTTAKRLLRDASPKRQPWMHPSAHMERGFTLAVDRGGTPDYFSPEIISSEGHSFPVDWWCAGVMLFELLSGKPPFEAAYPMQIYQRVMKGSLWLGVALACHRIAGVHLSHVTPATLFVRMGLP